MDALSERILAIPDWVKWALAIAGVALGLPAILWPELIVRGLRKWLVMQLRWVRRPGYRRFVKLYGWLLFVTGLLLALLLWLRP